VDGSLQGKVMVMMHDDDSAVKIYSTKNLCKGEKTYTTWGTEKICAKQKFLTPTCITFQMVDPSKTIQE